MTDIFSPTSIRLFADDALLYGPAADHNDMGGRIGQWWNACPKTKKSAVQVSATASGCGSELFTYI